QDIPKAHSYEPKVDVALAVDSDNQTLKVFVAVDNQNDSETVTLPQPDVDVSLAANSSDNSLKVFVAVGDKNDSETVTLPQPDVDVSLAANSSDNSLKVFVAVGDKNDSETVTLPQPEVDVALAVDSSNNSLKVFVAVGEKNDSETINLPSPLVNVEADIYDGTLAINVSVGDKDDTAIVNLPEFNPLDWIDLLKDILFDALKLWLLNELIDDLKNLIRDLLKELIEEILEGIFNLIKEYIDDLLNQEKYITGQAFYNDGFLTIEIVSSIGDTTFDVEIPMADLDEIERLLKDVHRYTVIDVNGETVTEFICAEEAEEGEAVEHSQLAYAGKSFTGLHALLKTVNDNLLTIFTEICEKNPVLAAPDWWQVRLRGNVPQIVCTFRRGNTRTYHSLSIPHPASTTKPENALIPEYEKGNWQGMIVLTDNSKFIVNCNSSGEAERICNVAASLIDASFLPNPFKVWLSERKGEPVASDPMKPTTIMYYSTGQRNLKPDWYMAIPKNISGEL
ncbi:MAG: hypothetical protein ACRCZI_13700, partial [Cetobacterium sp.]